MPREEIHKDDIGTIFEVTIKDGDDVVDVSGATTKQIILMPPKGTKKTKAAGFLNSGTDGIITYTTVDGDLNEFGTWGLQAFVVLSGGTWSSTIEDIEVYDNL